MESIAAWTGAVVLLDEARIHAALNPGARALLRKLEIHRQIDSTNTYLMALARRRQSKPVDGAFVCLAEQQTKGRGRRGRVWQSPFAANLYMSVLYCFDLAPSRLLALSPFCAVRVARALKNTGLPDIQIKWPNDLLWQGKKLGGILLEASGRDPCHIVIGIGINVAMASLYDMTGAIGQAWVDLDTAARAMIDRNTLAALLLNEMLPFLARFGSGEDHDLSAEWAEFDALYDCEVTLRGTEQEVRGIAKGVDGKGAIQLECNDRLLTFNVGELSLRANTHP